MFLTPQTHASSSFPLGTADPYVTLRVEKDGIFYDTAVGEVKKTKVLRNVTNPVFNEVFTFHLDDLKDKKLNIKVHAEASRGSALHPSPLLNPTAHHFLPSPLALVP
jgi:Ca2+-dependent lipid-binding protein